MKLCDHCDLLPDLLNLRRARAVDDMKFVTLLVFSGHALGLRSALPAACSMIQAIGMEWVENRLANDDRCICEGGHDVSLLLNILMVALHDGLSRFNLE